MKLTAQVLLICSVMMLPFAQAEELPGDSVYQLTTKWRDQNGSSIQLRRFEGKSVLMGMVYTSCPHACPMTVSKIQQIEKAIQKGGPNDLHIVLASFDVKKDKPNRLKKYMASHNLDEAKWTFLSAATEGAARELAAVLGISYKAVGGGDFSHSNVITLLDKAGVPKSKVESLDAKIDSLVSTALEMHSAK